MPKLIEKSLENSLGYYMEMGKKHGPATIFEEINAYQPKVIPDPPMELIEFRKLPDFQKRDKEGKFFKQALTREYLEEKWKAETYNRDTFFHLYELFQVYEGNERRAIYSKLNQFYRAIINTKPQFKALAIDMRKFKFDKEDSEKVDWSE